MPWHTTQNDHVLLHLKIQPKAKQNAWLDVIGEVRKVAIKAPPQDGAANAELIKFIAKTFKITQKEVEIIRGQTSKLKTVKIPKVDLPI